MCVSLEGGKEISIWVTRDFEPTLGLLKATTHTHTHTKLLTRSPSACLRDSHTHTQRCHLNSLACCCCCCDAQTKLICALAQVAARLPEVAGTPTQVAPEVENVSWAKENKLFVAGGKQRANESDYSRKRR